MRTKASKAARAERDAPTTVLTQVEFGEADFPIAQRIARALGYEQTAYTSTSALWGLFCLPENPVYAQPGQPTHGACIIKTRELRFLVVQDLEDLGMDKRGTPRGSVHLLRGRR